MKHLPTLSALALCLALLLPGVARAAELIMFNSPTCDWCEAWENDVGVIYDETDEGRAVPLQRVGIHDARPAGLEDIKGVIYTPTFVLLERGREVGRITGYPGEANFWGLLGEMIGKLEPVAGCPQGGAKDVAAADGSPASAGTAGRC